ncbi:MAG: C-terminal binding protein [Cyclobacteriaceae bacterium]
MREDNRIVSVIDTGYESFEEERKILREAGYELNIFEGLRNDLKAKVEFAKDSEGLLIRWSEINTEFLKRFTDLKAICRYGVGYDNINLADAKSCGVKVANVSGYASHSVSDHTLMLLFAVLRDLEGSMKQLRGDYTQPGRKDTFELHEKTLGIIGLGRIGSTFCQKAKPLFREIIAYDPYIGDDRFSEVGARKVGKDELISSSDVISLHCNLTDESRHIIDNSAFERMDKKPILINTARGGVVDEEALRKALKEDRLFGAGIDVFRDEPPLADMDEVINHPKVVATGHNAWYSSEAQEELQRRAARNLVKMLQGQECEDRLV